MPRPARVIFSILCVALFATLGDVPRWHLVVRAKAAEKEASDVPKDSSVVSTNAEEDALSSVSSVKKLVPVAPKLPGAFSPQPSDAHAGLVTVEQVTGNKGTEIFSNHVPKKIEELITPMWEQVLSEAPVNLLVEEVLRWFNNYPLAAKDSSVVHANEEKDLLLSVSSENKPGSTAPKSSEISSSRPPKVDPGLAGLKQLAHNLGLDASSFIVPKEVEEKIMRMWKQFASEKSAKLLTKEVLSWFNNDLPAAKDSSVAVSTNVGEEGASSSVSLEKTPIGRKLSEAPSSFPPLKAPDVLASLKQLTDKLQSDISSIDMPEDIEDEITRVADEFANELPLNVLIEQVLKWIMRAAPAPGDSSVAASTNVKENSLSSVSSENPGGPTAPHSSATSYSPPSEAYDGLARLKQLPDNLEFDLSSNHMPKETEDSITRIGEDYANRMPLNALTQMVFSSLKNDPSAPKDTSVAISTNVEEDPSSSVSSKNPAGPTAPNSSATLYSPPSEAYDGFARLKQLADKLEFDVSSNHMPQEIEDEITRIGEDYANKMPLNALTLAVFSLFKNDPSAPKNSRVVSTNVQEDASSSVSLEKTVAPTARKLSEAPSSSPPPEADIQLAPLEQSADNVGLRLSSIHMPKEMDKSVTRPGKQYDALVESLSPPKKEEKLSWPKKSSRSPAQVQHSVQNIIKQDDQPAEGKEPLSIDANSAIKEVKSNTHTGDLLRDSQIASTTITSPSKEEEDSASVKSTVDDKSSVVADGVNEASRYTTPPEERQNDGTQVQGSIGKSTMSAQLGFKHPLSPGFFTRYRDPSGPATPFPDAVPSSLPHFSPSSNSESEAGDEVSHAEGVIPGWSKPQKAVMRAVEDGERALDEQADLKAEPESVTRSAEQYSTIGGLQPETAGLLVLNQFSQQALQKLDPASRQKLAAYLGSLSVEQQQNLLYYNAISQYFPEADATKLKQLMEHVHKMRNPQESFSNFAVQAHPVEDAHSAVRVQQTTSSAQKPNPFLAYDASSSDYYYPQTSSATQGAFAFGKGISNRHHPVSSSSSSTNTSSSNSSSANTSTSNSRNSYNAIYTNPTSSSSSSSTSVHTGRVSSDSTSGGAAYTNPSSSSTTSSYSSMYTRPTGTATSSFQSTFTGPHYSSSNTFPTSSTSRSGMLPTTSSTLTSSNTTSTGNTTSNITTGTASGNPLTHLHSREPHSVNLSEQFAPPYNQFNNAQGPPSMVPPGSQASAGFHPHMKAAPAPPTGTLSSSSLPGTSYTLPPITASVATSKDTSVAPPVGGLPRTGSSLSYISQTQGFQRRQQEQPEQQTLPSYQLQQGAQPPQQQYAYLSQLPQEKLSYLPEQQQQQVLHLSQYPQHFVSPQQQQQFSASWTSSSNPAVQQQQQLPAQYPSSYVKHMGQDGHSEQQYNHLAFPTIPHVPQQQMKLPVEVPFFPSDRYSNVSSSADTRGTAGSSQPFQLPQPLSLLPDLGDLSLRKTLPLLEPITTLPVIQPLVAPLQQLFGTAPQPGADAFRSVYAPEGSSSSSSSSNVFSGDTQSPLSLSTISQSILPRDTTDALLRPVAEVLRLAADGVVTPTVTHANELLRDAHEFNTRVHQGSLQATQLFNDLSAYRTANPGDPFVKLLSTLEETAATISSSSNMKEGATSSAAAAAADKRASRQLQHSRSSGISSPVEEVLGPNKGEAGKKRNGGGHLRRRKAPNNDRGDLDNLLLQGMQFEPVKDDALATTQATTHEATGDVARNNAAARASHSVVAPETAAHTHTPPQQGSLPVGDINVVNGNMTTSQDKASYSSSSSSDSPLMVDGDESSSIHGVVGEVKYNLTSKDDPFDFSSFASGAAAKKKNSETTAARTGNSSTTPRMTGQQRQETPKPQEEKDIPTKVSNVIGATVDAALDLLARQQQRQALLRGQSS